jgi:hypothetical protein
MDSGNSIAKQWSPAHLPNSFCCITLAETVWRPLHKPCAEIENCQDEQLSDPASPQRLAAIMMFNGKKI